MHARRQAAAFVRNELADADENKDALQNCFRHAPRYQETARRVYKNFEVGPRRGDGAPMAIIEFVD